MFRQNRNTLYIYISVKSKIYFLSFRKVYIMKKKAIYIKLEENTHKRLEELANGKYKGNKTTCIENLILNQKPENPLDSEYDKLYASFRETYEKILQQINVNNKKQTVNNITLTKTIEEFQTTTKQLLEELKKLRPSEL